MTPTMTSSIISLYGQDPFLVLMSCLLSLRTKDAVTLQASLRLFQKAITPQDIIDLSVETLAKIIYPVGFYRRKAVLLPEVCQDLLNRFGGKVPSSYQELLSIKGVGHKTANLVLGEGFGIPAICVDTHVHRISNRLGLVSTQTPQQTEEALKQLLPKEYWIEFNRLVVIWGQNICVPVSPFCSRCSIYDLCERKAVLRKR